MFHGNVIARKLLMAVLIVCLVVLPLPTAYANWTGGHDVMGTAQAKTTWYFAEGCSRNGFNTWLCLYNPDPYNGTDTNISYFLETGEVRTIGQYVPANSRRTVDVCGTCKGEHDIACKVTSTLPVVAERSVYFDNNGITGGHVAMGAGSPQRTWYFAEGCTQPGFTEWLCMLNPSSTRAATVQVQYLLEGGGVVDRTKVIPANSRFTQNVRDEVGDGKNVSVKVMGATSQDTTVCERPMYFNYQGKWNGGHDSPGVNALSKKWLFAEGCTLGGFDTWLTLQNPGTSPAMAKITYMMNGGDNLVKSYAVGPQTRLTVNVNADVGPNKDVSTEVDSDLPIAAERPMYFLYHGAWDGGSDSFGIGAAQKDLMFAEGCSRAGFETWVCIQNPNAQPADLTVSFFETTGRVVTEGRRVPAHSRVTISANAAVGPEQDFSIKVSSNVPVVAERAMYFDYQGKYVTHAHLTARFINVGEGDSCVLKVSDNGQDFFALVDTGKSGQAGNVVAELQSMGCSELNVLVLTHPDADHTGSAVAVMNSFKVDEEWDPGIDGSNSQTWQNVKATIAAKGIPRKRPTAGQTFGWDEVQTEVLNPPAGASYSETNDWSIVLVESLGSEDVMLTGDAQSAAQQFMMGENFPDIEVFKAPHHGADSGCYQPFFNKVHPANSVISVGPNSYGHPSQTVINSLAAFGAVFRTDVNGDVTVDASPNSLQITCQNNPSPSPSPNPSPSPTPVSGPFWGSKNSNVYHYPSCTYAQRISPANLVVFVTAQDAVNAGYRPCKVCNPPLP